MCMHSMKEGCVFFMVVELTCIQSSSSHEVNIRVSGYWDVLKVGKQGHGSTDCIMNSHYAGILKRCYHPYKEKKTTTRHEITSLGHILTIGGQIWSVVVGQGKGEGAGGRYSGETGQLFSSGG